MKEKKIKSETVKTPKIPNSSKGRALIGVACIAAALLIGFVLVPMAEKHSAKAVSLVKSDNNSAAPSSSKESDYKLNDGQYLISVSTKNFCDSVSGKLRGGDIATVFIPPTSAAGNAVTSGTSVTAAAENPPELQYVKVVAVTTSSGQDTNGSIQSSSGTANNQPATVTLLVNVKQAAILAGTEQNTVHFALAYRGGGDKAKELLNKQEEYFKSAQNTSSQPSSNNGASSSASASNETAPDTTGTATAEVTK